MFARNGFHIITCGRSAASLEKMKKEVTSEFSVKVSYEAVDLGLEAGRRKFVEMVPNATSSVKVLINNTGTFEAGGITTEPPDALDIMLNTNLRSAYSVSRGILPLIPKGGHIFNICSTASIVPYINGGSYCVSKYAMYGFSKVLREELKPKGVKVTSVLPGATYTSSWEGTDFPKDRFINPEDLAQLVWTIFNMSESTVVEEAVIRPMMGDIVDD